MKGGSGKVVASKPNDRIFLYYSDHGGPGVLGEFRTSHLTVLYENSCQFGQNSFFFQYKFQLKCSFLDVINFLKENIVYFKNCNSHFLLIGMPNMPFLYAMDFINVLKKKHASGSYKEMVWMSVLHFHFKFVPLFMITLICVQDS